MYEINRKDSAFTKECKLENNLRQAKRQKQPLLVFFIKRRLKRVHKQYLKELKREREENR